MRFTDWPERRPRKAYRLRSDRVNARVALRGLGAALRNAVRCRRGAYAVEFAMIANALLLMVLGAVDVTWHGLTAVAMENATLKASRSGSLGCLQADGTRAGQVTEATLKAAAVEGGGGLLAARDLTLTASVYASLSGARSGSGGTAGSAGTGGQIVVYTLTYTRPYLLVGTLASLNSRNHTGTIIIKNEPFAEGGASAAGC